MREPCGCDLTGPVPPAAHIVDGHPDPAPVPAQEGKRYFLPFGSRVVSTNHPENARELLALGFREVVLCDGQRAALSPTDRPAYCCGRCPAIVTGGYDCTCEGNPRCAAPSEPEGREA
ncbi:hypothetical protein [Serinibacter salmoneus]|uniref:Uncharacterized protein n=1 Tax=Serinibacter salmoneus TaxID=556530 RepID=A0A2A9D0D6_9MICO|nr:hypothetical protein [Serinibacter salmoneus]PFG19851.1 hypothetical protein ATL40_1427 [Serinibacter salmoneus]